MQRAAVVLALATGCGRIGFGTALDASGVGDNATGDTAGDMASVDPSLLVWLPMDELTTGIVNNAAASGISAGCSGSTCPQLVAGVRGNAYQFDGVADLIAIGNATGRLDLSTGTMALWGRIDTLPGTYAELIGKPFGVGSTNSWEISTGFQLGIVGGGDSTSAGSYTTAFPDTIGHWDHIAATWTPTNLTLYINGIAFDGITFEVANDTHAVFVGGDDNGGSPADFFPGSIDDLRIYDRVLSASELAALAVP